MRSSDETSRTFEQHGATLSVPDAVEQDDPERIDDVVPTAGYETLPVVGLGGSAGSIRALQRFFEATPPNSDLAYVVLVHLSPAHEISLPLLVECWTSMRVKAASDGEKLEQNNVYIVPPGKHISAVDNSLKLEEMETDRWSRVLVDLFFRSLA